MFFFSLSLNKTFFIPTRNATPNFYLFIYFRFMLFSFSLDCWEFHFAKKRMPIPGNGRGSSGFGLTSIKAAKKPPPGKLFRILKIVLRHGNNTSHNQINFITSNYLQIYTILQAYLQKLLIYLQKQKLLKMPSLLRLGLIKTVNEIWG